MPLSIGARLGPYEIVAPLGKGGMGEVYRARDTKLNRDVAIKVLPDLFVADRERLIRFEREAQVLAALNHQNIAHVHGVIEDPPALVMELVEGEDLSERIARGAIPLDDALPMARQIAEALDAAHERGIVHRDLKPANIKIRNDGTVKVLDFGLAKAAEGPTGSGSHGVMTSPTFTSPAMTQIGMILGTAAYMAPEQARGRMVDKRADIWAFGCVLFEMITGRRPFGGDDLTDTVAAIVKDEPAWNFLPTNVPPTVVTLLRRCLNKDPKERLRDIGEARIAIDKAGTEPAPPSAVAPARASRPHWVALGAAVLFAAAVSVGATWWWVSSRAPDVPFRRFVLATPAAGGGSGREFSISPDGRKVAFVSGRKLHVWELSQLRPRELKSAGEGGVGDSAPLPFWSPDSDSVAYFAGGRLWRISAQDGPASAICNMPGAIIGGAWQPDGTIVFSTTRGAMYKVPALGGEPSVLLALAGDGEVDFHQPIVLPDGRGLLYAVHRREGVDTFEVFSGGKRKVVMRTTERVRRSPQVLNLPSYSPTGHIIYRLDEGNVGVWAVPFSLTRLETTGQPFLIASGARNPSVADDGTLIYAPTAEAAPGQLVWIRPDGTVQQAIGDVKQGIESTAISADQNRIAYTAVENNNSDVWVFSPDRGSTRITTTPGNETRPQWMPDDRTLVFSCPTEQGGAMCAKAGDGSGETRVLIKNASEVMFAPDGKYLVYQTSGTAERGLKVWNMQPNDPPRPLVLSTFELFPMGFSADSRYLAYSSFQSGSARIYVRQFPSGEGQWEIPDLTSELAIWPRGGREMFAVTGQGRELLVSAVPVDTTAAPSFGKPRVLFTTTDDRLSLFAGFTASADGKRFLTVQRKQTESDATGIVVVQNWWSEFKGRK
jgi:Tol biopolymer transport system component